MRVDSAEATQRPRQFIEMDVAQFAYDLPPELIAQAPLRPRDHSRLMVVRRAGGAFEHRRFHEITEILRPGDMLVLNDTRVIRARLLCRRPTGGKAELLLLRPHSDGTWQCLVRPGRAARLGEELLVGNGAATAQMVSATEFGGRNVRFTSLVSVERLLEQFGNVPTPPYIRQSDGSVGTVTDGDDYQTVYARSPGSAAAPTAGFHFTPELLDRLNDRGIAHRFLTLHIGLDTFRPMTAERIEDHIMHSEHFELSRETAEALAKTRASGGRILAVGTTTARALEAAADEHGVRAGGGWTRLFITPGYSFRVVDALITNFHLPRSTLLVLVSALAGRDRILSAYREAIAAHYRFYSFGDAMLIL